MLICLDMYIATQNKYVRKHKHFLLESFLLPLSLYLSLCFYLSSNNLRSPWAMFALGVSCRYLPVRRVQVLECVCSAQTKLFQTYILYITCNMSHKGLNVRLAMTQHQVTLSDKTAALFNDWDKNAQN